MFGVPTKKTTRIVARSDDRPPSVQGNRLFSNPAKGEHRGPREDVRYRHRPPEKGAAGDSASPTRPRRDSQPRINPGPCRRSLAASAEFHARGSGQLPSVVITTTSLPKINNRPSRFVPRCRTTLLRFSSETSPVPAVPTAAPKRPSLQAPGRCSASHLFCRRADVHRRAAPSAIDNPPSSRAPSCRSGQRGVIEISVDEKFGLERMTIEIAFNVLWV
jgi:hypothetical protein